VRILQVVRQLPYGGDPVYVCRLMSGLREIGVESAVLTEGGPLLGMYEERWHRVLEFPSLRSTALDAVAPLVAAEPWDVMLAHHYQSSRVAHGLSRRIGIPYVMTIHAKRGLVGRMLVNYWSDEVIVLTGGVERSLRGPFGVRPDRIHRSRLTVDCDVHRPGPQPADCVLRRAEEELIVLHVSRLEYRKTKPCIELVRGMPRLLESVPRARLALLGLGPGLERVLPEVQAVNRRCGDVIRLLEPRPGLAGLLRSADVAVATGLVAREALACGCPVLAVGRMGYVGPIDQEHFPLGDDGNFGDHDHAAGPPRADRFARDLAGMLSDLDHWRREALALAELTSREYSPARAASEIVVILRDVLTRSRPRRSV